MLIKFIIENMKIVFKDIKPSNLIHILNHGQRRADIVILARLSSKDSKRACSSQTLNFQKFI